MARNPERELKLVARLLEPSCVGEEWHARYRDLANYVGEHLADRMLRKAREKRDAEADKQRDAKRIAAAMMGKAEQRPAKPAVGKAGRPFGTGYGLSGPRSPPDWPDPTADWPKIAKRPTLDSLRKR